jgi:hypothetical protein
MLDNKYRKVESEILLSLPLRPETSGVAILHLMTECKNTLECMYISPWKVNVELFETR